MVSSLRYFFWFYLQNYISTRSNAPQFFLMFLQILLHLLINRPNYIHIACVESMAPVSHFCYFTGSSRKSDKSNTVFTGTNFNKILVLSAVLGQELAANLSSRASRSIIITWWHPQKLEPPMCFQGLVGFLRPTTASRPLTKGPHRVFLLVWSKISTMNAFILFF